MTVFAGQPGHGGTAAETLAMTGFIGTTMGVRATPSDDGLVMGLEVDDTSAAIISHPPLPMTDAQGRVTQRELPIFHTRRDRVRAACQPARRCW